MNNRFFVNIIQAFIFLLIVSQISDPAAVKAATSVPSGFFIPISLSYDNNATHFIGADDTVWEYRPATDRDKVLTPTGKGDWRLDGIIQFVEGKVSDGATPSAALTDKGEAYYQNGQKFQKIEGLNNVLQISRSARNIYALDADGAVWALCGYDEWSKSGAKIKIGGAPVKVPGLPKMAALMAGSTQLRTSNLTADAREDGAIAPVTEGAPYREISLYFGIGQDDQMWAWGVYYTIYAANGDLTRAEPGDMTPFAIPLDANVTYFGRPIADVGKETNMEIGSGNVFDIFNVYPDGQICAKLQDNKELPILNAAGSEDFKIKLLGQARGQTEQEAPPVNIDPDITAYKNIFISMTIGEKNFFTDSVKHDMDTAPYLGENARTMVPIRFIAEAANATVSWTPETKACEIALAGKTVTVTVGKELPGEMGKAELKDNRLFVPLRYVIESLGAGVEWDSSAQSALITMQTKMTDADVIQLVRNYASAVVALTNAERQKTGLAPLAADVDLTAAAQLKAEDMRDNNYFDHISPTYGSPSSMLAALGAADQLSVGENINSGASDPEYVMKSWMNSEGHRANILNSEYEKIGVGFTFAKNSGTLWTMILSKPRE